MHNKPSRKRKLSLAAAAVVGCLVIWLSIRHVIGEAARRDASRVVTELGGKVGSIPYEPIGTEIRIHFEDQTLSREQLARLSVVDSLPRRHHATIWFEDTNLTPDDIEWLRQICPHCKLRLTRNGENVVGGPLGKALP